MATAVRDRFPTASSTPRDFRVLTAQIRAAGLLDRRPRYYATTITLTLAAFAVAWDLVVLVGSRWAVLAVAAALGLIATQLGFLGHDAGHRQIFTSPRANRLFGLVVGNGIVGLSFGWWVPKHNAHHAHPNEPGRDPDIGIGGVAAPPPAADATPGHGVVAWLDRHQTGLFFPLMLLRSTGLYVSGIQDLRRRSDRAAVAERLLIVARAAVYLTVVFWVLAPLEAVAFLLVYEAVFSIYLGCSFAPNHKGMPLVDAADEAGFAERQVTTARNLTGGRWTGLLFGGLNYQIEHHLFPTMPRPNLARAQGLVRGFCLENHFGYCESSAIGSFRRVLASFRVAATSPPPV